MSEGSARVDSIDSIKLFRIALLKFAEACSVAMTDAESEMHQTQNWLDNEQLSHWQSQIRKRTELLGRAKEALRMKKLFKDSSGRTPSAVEEEKAVRLAQARLEEAEQKLVATKKYSRVLQREIQNYKGSIQRFATTVESDVPVAVAQLDAMAAALETYVAYAPGDAATTPASIESQPPPPPVEMTDDSGANNPTTPPAKES